VRQTLRATDFEVVIVDDCSTERQTVATIEKFESVWPNVRSIRHEHNVGLNESRKSGVKSAVGDYVIFVDGDDVLTRDAVENLLLEAKKRNADIVTAPFFRWAYSSHSYYEQTLFGERLPSDLLARLKLVLACERSFTMCGRLFRRQILTEDVFYFPEPQLHEDITTFTRIIFKPIVAAGIETPIYFYTINENSITSQFSHRHAQGIFYAFTDWIFHATNAGILKELTPAISCGVETLVNLCVRRCIAEPSLVPSEKTRLLLSIQQWYKSLPINLIPRGLKWTKFLLEFTSDTEIETQTAGTTPHSHGQPSDQDSVRGLVPSEMAMTLKDKVVFIAQVDYQVRAAAIFSRALRLRGHSCVVLDNSNFVAKGARKFRAGDPNLFWRTTHIPIVNPPYGPDWLCTAKLVIAFNDFNDDFREALEYRNRLNLPSACIIEGINDFLRLDFDERRHLPYRRCNYVFLAGLDDKRFFADRETFIIGLPNVEALLKKSPVYPSTPLVILNVNFTYGALEHCRDEFVFKAVAAFNRLGLDFAISQHPMDFGDMAGLSKSPQTQYELIDGGTVFVSRFATGILEALASGKPVIYFNPHSEKVDKFNEPLGAYEIAHDEDELEAALTRVLQDVKNKIDFRARALPFLLHHASFGLEGSDSGQRLSNAVESILESSECAQKSVAALFFEKLTPLNPGTFDSAKFFAGSFPRECHAQLNEEELIGRYFGKSQGIMLDVGANFGNSLDIFWGKGWTVHAFEPDPSNRRNLLAAWPSSSRVIVNEQAVSDQSGLTVPFYSSEESTGISSLSAFTSGHRLACEVTTTTLRDYYRSSGLSHVNFLKIDIEGHDKFALDGFPWESDKPDVILVEFEDAKTVPLRYNWRDLADSLIERGYTVYVSEWWPIVRYGIAHDWRGLLRDNRELNLSGTWGNLIGFLEDPGEVRLRLLTQQTVKFNKPFKRSRANAKGAQLALDGFLKSNLGRYYVAVRNAIRLRWPRLFRILQRVRWWSSR